MKDLADKLRARAIAGEDFNKLQADAYRVAGIKSITTTDLGKIRRISLPPDQASVMDLKPGQVSQVITSSNGYFIYKAKVKETLSLDQARDEIKGVLRSQRIQDETRLIEDAATSTLNQVYFYSPRAPQGVAKAAK
jgi:parvulin-like peptidyl-prolyl isomerase